MKSVQVWRLVTWVTLVCLNTFFLSFRFIASIANSGGFLQQKSNNAIQTPNETTAKEIVQFPEALQLDNTTICCENGAPSQRLAEATCYTERACFENTTFPFASLQQANYFRRADSSNTTLVKQHRQACFAASHGSLVNTSWCSKNQPVPYPRGCSKFNMGTRSGPWDRVYLFVDAQLAFCGVPKAGITRWLSFLRFTFGAKDYLSNPYYKEDIKGFHLDEMRPSVVEEVLTSPNWTRAILIREPAERLLSAYLDKVQNKPKLFGMEKGEKVSFELFINSLQSDNWWFTDPHWRPQAYSCGIGHDITSMDFVGSLDKVGLHTKKLLDMVGLWESHGKYYQTSANMTDHKVAGPPFARYQPDPPLTDTLGFQQIEQTDHHAKGSQSLMEEYYTPELLAKVKYLYWMDYQLYDVLQSTDKTSGSDIAKLLNPKQCGAAAIG